MREGEETSQRLRRKQLAKVDKVSPMAAKFCPFSWIAFDYVLMSATGFIHGSHAIQYTKCCQS